MTKKLLFAIFALPMLANAQFTQGFEGGTTIPSGWSTINQGDPKTWAVVSGGVAHSGSNMVSIEYSFDGAHDDYLITPAINVTANVSDYFSFYAKSRDDRWPEAISLKVSTTTPTANAFTTTIDANIAPTGGDYVKYSYNLSAFVGQTIYIAFYSNTDNAYYFDIDDVKNSAIPLCEDATNVTSSEVTSTTAKINWTVSATPGANYDIEYGPKGFAHGAGTIVTSTTNSKTLSGLTPSNLYDVYVRSNCSTNGTSAWSAVTQFGTSCVAKTSFPLLEKFDATTIPVCWSEEAVNGSGKWTFVNANDDGSIVPKSAPNMAQFKIGNKSDVTKLVLPAMDLSSVDDPAIKFSLANVEWSGDIDALKVYYKANVSDSWVQIGSTYSTEHTAWTDVILPLPNKSNAYYVAFEGISGYGRGMNIDDVTVANAATLAVNNNVADRTISVYPNPAKDVVNIKTNKDVNSIQIFSLTGQLVKTIDKNVRAINVSDLKKGVYLLRVKSATQDESFKIIKE